tara:strand:+ start:629 stop:973 length:345 start_codon:yes stop_codon:yes gene_type:complete
MVDKKLIFNGITGKQEIVDYTADEQTIRDANVKAWNDASGDRKLAQIKQMRLERLKATDYMANSDVTMPDYIKTWRQTLRDLPQNNTTESQYDTLLARDNDGNLTNSVWKQPTE